MRLNVCAINKDIASRFNLRGMIKDVPSRRPCPAICPVQRHHLRARSTVVSTGRNLNDDLRLVVRAGSFGDLDVEIVIWVTLNSHDEAAQLDLELFVR